MPPPAFSVAICPGYVRTEMLEHYYQSQPDPQAVREALMSTAREN